MKKNPGVHISIIPSSPKINILVLSRFEGVLPRAPLTLDCTYIIESVNCIFRCVQSCGRSCSFFCQVGAGAGKAPSLMNIQMELRKCCNHPFMVRGVEDHEVDQIVGDLVEEAQKDVSLWVL